jgi:hypothetical protein
MITQTGKNILAKFLIGQAPSYASHIAIGCGATPLESAVELGDYSSKNVLDFEMFRVPIVSRGYITEDGVSKIVFVGELPSEEKYDITEIGIFSAGANSAAGSADSKILFTFSTNENWEFHTVDPSTGTAEALEEISVPLNTGESIDDDYDGRAFIASSTNGVFGNEVRLERLEVPRFLDSSVFMSGNMCDIGLSSGNNVLTSNSILENHIHYMDISVSELGRNSSFDIIKTAFSVINKNLNDTDPVSVRLMIEFISSEVEDALLARIDINETDFSEGRYKVISTQLGQLKGKENGFTWDAVNTARIYASVRQTYAITANSTVADGKVEFTTGTTKHGFAVGSQVTLANVTGTGIGSKILEVSSDGLKFKVAATTVTGIASATATAPTSNYLVALDGIRLDNVSTPNALYGLTSYSPIVNAIGSTTFPAPITKNANTTNIVEFRFAMDVGATIGGES